MAGAIKQNLKAQVERSIANLKESPEYRLLGLNPNTQQDLTNRMLYDLYEDATRNNSKTMLRILKEVLDEYPGFPEYFKNQRV